jgi:hypothetical protein
LFSDTVVATTVLDGGIGAASALKAAYAGWTKGSMALLLSMRQFAAAECIEEALLAEWRTSIPGLEAQYSAAVAAAESKGWRWVGEMEEIAAAFTTVGLPDGFCKAAAATFASPHFRR